jgi:hypothetical protein
MLRAYAKGGHPMVALNVPVKFQLGRIVATAKTPAFFV